MRLPFSIKVLLEAVKRLAAWNAPAPLDVELPFLPARVILQGPWLLPVVHRPADERDGREPDRAGAAARERALASGC